MEQGALTSGTKGIRTYQLQLRLKALKFDPGEPDGAFGSKTTMAVWAYQALNGLTQDGVVTPELEAQILAGTRRHAAAGSRAHPQRGRPGQAGCARLR